MKKLDSKDATGISMAIFALILGLGFMAYVCLFDIIYQDVKGNPVVCDVGGDYYSVSHPTCKKALDGKWRRNNVFIWQGTCRADGICTPKKH